MPTTENVPVESQVASEISRATEILSAFPGVRRIWFFGSRAKKRGRTGSDLDFAVLGLPREVHFQALGELMLALRLPVDLVRWEEASDTLRAEITRQGTVIYAC